MGVSSFPTANHLLFLREEKRDAQKIQDKSNSAKLKGPVYDLQAHNHHLTLRSKNTGSWLTVQVNTVTSTVLVATQFSHFFAHII